MALFLVSYDLVKQKDYQTLWNELSRLNAKRALLSAWVMRLTDDSVVTVTEHFRKFIDADDRIFVVKFSDADWASGNALANPNNL